MPFTKKYNVFFHYFALAGAFVGSGSLLLSWYNATPTGLRTQAARPSSGVFLPFIQPAQASSRNHLPDGRGQRGAGRARSGPGGAGTRPASAPVAPGATGYGIDWFPGTGGRVLVVGPHRETKRMIQLVLAVELLESFRSRVCYVPAVIELIKAHFPAEEIHRLNREFAG